MSTSFPTNLDTSATIPVEGAAIPLSTNHVTTHQNIQDAIEAIEAKVGADSSAVTTSHDYKLSEVTDKAAGKTATQTLTNKTLTSPVINVGSDATGDMYYRNAGVLTRIPVGTDNQIMKLNGTTPNWEAETTTVDASTTVKGIVEAATSAEVTAGTATGATGAVLAVTPDALAGSTPAFNGGSITNISGKLNLVTTDVTYASSTAENNLLSYTVPANTLGTGNIIRVTLHVPDLKVTTAQTWTLRFKYGATTIATKAFTAAGATTLQGKIEFLLANTGTTNSQNGSYALTLAQVNYVGNGNTVVNLIGESAQGTAAIDSTASQTLAVTSQHNNSSVNDTITVSMIVVEIIK